MKEFLYVSYVTFLVGLSYFLYDAYMFANYEAPGGCYDRNWRGQIAVQWLSYTIVIMFVILLSLLVYKFLTKKKSTKLHFYILTTAGLLIVLGVGFIFSKPLVGQATPSVCTSQGSY